MLRVPPRPDSPMCVSGEARLHRESGMRQGKGAGSRSARCRKTHTAGDADMNGATKPDRTFSQPWHHAPAVR